jgi:hypothetical protein
MLVYYHLSRIQKRKQNTRAYTRNRRCHLVNDRNLLHIGTMTISLMAFIKMTFSKMAFGIMTFSIMTLTIMPLSLAKLNMTLSKITFYIATLYILKLGIIVVFATLSQLKWTFALRRYPKCHYGQYRGAYTSTFTKFILSHVLFRCSYFLLQDQS